MLNPSPAPDERPLPYSSQQLKTLELVLTSHRIPCRRQSASGVMFLLVPCRFLAVAREQIALYQRENHDWPPPLPRREPLLENQLATLAVFLLLCGFANLTVLDPYLPAWARLDWHQLGSAHAGRILAGEWWRTATALTLHSGGLHLAGNVIFGILLVGRLARDLGSGLTWSLVLVSGMGGNLLNALLQSPRHDAVGASTAVFGALGILAGLNLIRYRKALWRRWALPLAGAFGLLAMLGAGGERTDLGAHLFGLLVGLASGAGAGAWLGRRGRPERWTNRLLGCLPAALILLAWLAAIHSA